MIWGSRIAAITRGCKPRASGFASSSLASPIFIYRIARKLNRKLASRKGSLDASTDATTIFRREIGNFMCVIGATPTYVPLLL